MSSNTALAIKRLEGSGGSPVISQVVLVGSKTARFATAGVGSSRKPEGGLRDRLTGPFDAERDFFAASSARDFDAIPLNALDGGLPAFPTEGADAAYGDGRCVAPALRDRTRFARPSAASSLSLCASVTTGLIPSCGDTGTGGRAGRRATPATMPPGTCVRKNRRNPANPAGVEPRSSAH